MSYSNEIPIKRLPTGRPLTPKEHDRNLDKISTNFDRVQTEFSIRMPDPVPDPLAPTLFAMPIMMWSGTIASIPEGWTLCNGIAVNGVTPPDLKSRFVVGVSDDFLSDHTIKKSTHSYKPGDGGPLSPNNNERDFEPAHNHGLPPSTGGTALQPNHLPEHQHILTDTGVVGGKPGVFWDAGGTGQEAGGDDSNSAAFSNTRGPVPTSPVTGVQIPPTPNDAHSHSIGGTTGLDGPRDNRPLYYALCFIAFVDKTHA